MPEISANRAKNEFGIATLHEEMRNGERRFRLKKHDGTAYIRTEAGSNSGWQNSHFHERVMETYVVQVGWMAFAELIDSDLSLCIYGANEIVTSRPGVVHNVFLPNCAVIHTIKHGVSQSDDRLTDERTAAFDKVTHALQVETDVHAAAIRRPRKATYSDEYRHFDNLIWQVPAWSTGIFAISIQALFGIFNADGPLALTAAAGVSAFTALCLACFSFVMMRFRTHQRGLKGYASTPAWLSASTLTQSLVTIESGALLGVALVMFGMRLEWAIGISTILAIGVIGVFETSVRRTQVRC